ncbi:MAG: MFS transporter [Pantoea sp.]|nr:MFS transporter [Pantoea sp.]
MTAQHSVERDSTRLHSAADERLTTSSGRKDFWRATLSCWLGTAMEYADFALYGLAAGIIFGDVFFPQATPAMALLSSFATWSVGFIARPIGAVLFGWIGDRKGRKTVMVITIILMGASTTLIGLIPSYAAIGVWAPACLVLLRFTQGLGAGAELSGGTVMLGEYAPVERRGLVSSVIALGSNSGTLLAALVWLAVVQMDQESLLAWGWRIPFLSSVLIALAALWIRRHLRETPVFERRKQELEAERAATRDALGRRITYRGFCLLLMFYAWPAFYLLDSREPAIVIPVIVVGMALASLGIYGVQAAWGVELFGVKHRYTKMAVAKELGSILSGGTAPLLAAAMLSWSGHWWPIAVYFSAMAAIGFFTTFVAPETRGRDLNLPEDAI